MQKISNNCHNFSCLLCFKTIVAYDLCPLFLSQGWVLSFWQALICFLCRFLFRMNKFHFFSWFRYIYLVHRNYLWARLLSCLEVISALFDNDAFKGSNSHYRVSCLEEASIHCSIFQAPLISVNFAHSCAPSREKAWTHVPLSNPVLPWGYHCFHEKQA